ncbi:MAG TPA: hemolysin family protein [Thermoleophilaceae bacterium]|nr:hemolysin family protein [Thermoleophilaceae bacterium]
MAIDLIFALLLVVANGVFVATEFSVARLRPTQVNELVRERRPGAKSAAHAVEHIDSYLSACQLGITLSSLGLGALGEPAFHDLIEPVLGDGAEVAGFGLATIVAFSVITTLHVVLGELAPKSAAISRTVSVALVMAPIMRVFYMATRPLVDLFNGMGNLVLKPFGIPPASEAGSQPHSEDELRELLRESSQGGLIEADEQQLSDAALVFGDVRAREAMIPRADIDDVQLDYDVHTVARVAIETGRTRLPVHPPEGGLEDAVGVINAKDLLPLLIGEDREADISGLVRPLAHVSESARVDEVLREMRADRLHLALVHDEHGTVTGLITMEDILEELVGEITDEFDDDEEDAFRPEGDRLIVDGSAPVRLLAERLETEIEGPHESTIGGYLSEELARVPDEGETVALLGRNARILEVEGTRIVSLAVLAPEPEDDEAQR